MRTAGQECSETRRSHRLSQLHDSCCAGSAAVIDTRKLGPDPEGPLVLIVEDDDDIRFLCGEALVHLGYRIAGERDAEQGIAAAVRLRPDIILMDLSMPGMSGIEATRLLKADPRTKSCLVIVVTGAPLSKFAEARAAGCDAFFRKPFDPSVIEHVVRARPPSVEPPGVSLPAGIVKRCSCGRKFTRSQWLTLAWCGQVRLSGRDAVVDLRNCTCGSSMALRLEDPGPPTSDCTAAAEAGHEPPLETIFVVDRDTHVRRLVLHFIGGEYLVRFFDDGYSALDHARRVAPSALVAEILIPRLDGLALCRLLKGDPATAHVPILLFSTLAAGDRARLAGADAFLEKPLEKEAFVASLLGLMTSGERRGAPPPRRLGVP